MSVSYSQESAPGRSGGVPDSLVLVVLGLLLSATVLVWSATGLAALLQHGGWPTDISVKGSAGAIRALASEPADVATAWPRAPAGELPRPGLFWGVFIGQLMLLCTAAVVLTFALARRRARREERRAHLLRAREAAKRQAEQRAGEEAARVAAAADAGAKARTRGKRRGSRRARKAERLAVLHEAAAKEHAGTEPDAATDAESDQDRRVVDPSATGTRAPAKPSPHEATAPGTEEEESPALVEARAARAALDKRTVPVDAKPSTTAPNPSLSGSALLLRHEADPADALASAEGAALVVTSDPALWSRTVGARTKLGPTHLYDPTHSADAPVRVRWSPERDCDAMGVAASRASALLAPVRSPAKVDAMTHQTAETILRCSLHAAAIDDQPFRQVHRWTTGGSAHEAVRILRTDRSAASGAAGELEAALIGYPERRDEATALIRHALGALSQLHVRNSCTASKADGLALESFVAEGGTLYALGESIEDPRRSPGAMPLVTALTTYVVELGRRMAGRSSSGRLDPPMTVLLDGPATVSPLLELPRLLRESERYGVRVYAYPRSYDQALAWWPELRSHPRPGGSGPGASLTSPPGGHTYDVHV